jgi:hypothetical protein
MRDMINFINSMLSDEIGLLTVSGGNDEAFADFLRVLLQTIDSEDEEDGEEVREEGNADVENEIS